MGCYILSLLIPDVDIQNLYYNGEKVKAAYFNGEKVWTEKHRVRWFDSQGDLLKTELVTDGKNATPPNVTDFLTDFYGYTLSGWNADYSIITADTDITALTTIETAHLFRKGYGVNPNYELGSYAKFYDGSTSYTETTGNANNDRIMCSVMAANGAYTNTRKVNFLSVPIDCDKLRANGITTLSVSGTYSMVTVSAKIAAYTTANVRAAFVALTDTPKNITITKGGIANADKVIQVAKTISTLTDGSYGYASDNSGTFSGSMTLPINGTYYLVIGTAQKNTRAKTTLTINTIWFE